MKASMGLVYLTVSAVLFGAYFAALMFFHALIPGNVVGQAALGAMLALIATVTFRPLRGWVQQLVDRLSHGGWYEYGSLVEEVGQALARALDFRTLVEVLVHRVPRAMRLPAAALWLEREGKMELAGASGVDVWEAQAWVREGRLAGSGEVRVSPARATVPLIVEGQVVGIWALAARPGGEWGSDDRRILTAWGRQAALAAQSVRLVAALRAKVVEVEGMHQRLLVAREEERAGMARELHDGVIQDLIGLSYRLEALQEGEGDARQVGEIHGRVDVLVDELRRVCCDLRPSAVNQLGLAAALQALAQEFSLRGLQVEVQVEDVSLPAAMAVGLYRIGQEALSNVWRHARASRAVVTLAREKEGVVLRVTDDGRGFDFKSAMGQDRCFGLLGMCERAEAMRGQLAVESAPGEGTQVSVWCDLRVPSLWGLGVGHREMVSAQLAGCPSVSQRLALF